MGFKEAFERYKEKKREEKEQFKAMERDIRLKKKLEQKMKSPAQKEYEFYQREKAKENLNAALKRERKERQEKMNKLSNPYNKKSLFKESFDIKDGNFMKGGIF